MASQQDWGKVIAGVQALIDAAGSGDAAAISIALLAGATPNFTYSGWSPLTRAALEEQTAAITALLAGGANPDYADSAGTTPLMCAAEVCHPAGVSALLAGGADVNCTSPFSGDTALHMACKSGCLDSASLLLDAGARVDMRNNDGEQPIDVVRAR